MRSLWLRPGRTIAHIAHENPGHLVHTLPVLAGLSYGTFDPIAKLTLEVGGKDGISLGGPLVTLLAVYVSSYVLSAIATMFGGRATPAATRVALAWSCLPLAVLLPLDVATRAFFSASDVSAVEHLQFDGFSLATVVLWTALLLQLIFRGWSLIILLTGLAAVNEFSRLKATLTATIGWALSFAVTVWWLLPAIRSSSAGDAFNAPAWILL
ncbi:MAG: YIP1 family protein [Pseudomonadota bacterium]